MTTTVGRPVTDRDLDRITRNHEAREAGFSS
jgi:hypothetical protein